MTHTPGHWAVLAMALAASASASTPALHAQAFEGGRRIYAENVYPTPTNGSFRKSEVAFTETEATRAYGYNTPFPEVARRRFLVDDYGAAADGQTDCTPAFYSALADALDATGPTEVIFGEAGRYLLLPHPDLGSDDMAILNIRGATNMVIRGQGRATVLTMGDPALGGVLVDHCATVMLRDFAIDYNPLPFTQGTVATINEIEGWLTLEVDPGYPEPSLIPELIPGNHSGYRMGEAQDGAILWPSIGNLPITGVEHMADRAWRLSASPEALAGYITPGARFIYVGRRFAQMALGLSFSSDVHVKDLTVHASPTCGLGVSNVDGLEIDGYADAIPPGSDRLLASDADGIFVHGARDGVTIKNSYFMGQGDDCINLHCPAFAAQHLTQADDTHVVLKAPMDLRPNDVIEIMNPNTSELRGRLSIAEAENTADGTGCSLSLRQGLSTVGYDPATDFLYPVSLTASNFKIVGNYFGQNRSRCVLIRARHGLIEANTSENAEGYGIDLGYGGTAWYEGVLPTDVTIRRNVFRNITNVGLAAVIQAGDGSDFRNIEGLVIEENTFINTRKMAIALANVAGATITGNTIASEPGRRNTWNHPEWFPVDCSVYLVNCTGIVLDALTVDDPAIAEAVIYISDDCAPGEVGVRIGEIDANAGAAPIVLDKR